MHRFENKILVFFIFCHSLSYSPCFFSHLVNTTWVIRTINNCDVIFIIFQFSVFYQYEFPLDSLSAGNFILLAVVVPEVLWPMHFPLFLVLLLSLWTHHLTMRVNYLKTETSVALEYNTFADAEMVQVQLYEVIKSFISEFYIFIKCVRMSNKTKRRFGL